MGFLTAKEWKGNKKTPFSGRDRINQIKNRRDAMEEITDELMGTKKKKKKKVPDMFKEPPSNVHYR